MSEEDFIHNKV